MKDFKLNTRHAPRYQYKYLVFLLVCITVGASSFSQKVKSNAVYHWNDAIAIIAYPPQFPGAYKFREGAVTGGTNFFNTYKKTFGLQEDDVMKLVRTDKDPIGMLHHRFQQYYKGIKIEGAEYILHEKDEYINSANGKMVYGLNKSITPTITEPAALLKALQAIPASQYKYSNADDKVINRASYKPRAELVFQKAHSDLMFIPANFMLCYRFDVYKSTGEGYKVFIDAISGELVNKLPLQSNCIATTTATNFYGKKTIYTTQPSLPLYYLWDNCTSSTIHVYDNKNSTGEDRSSPYTSRTNTDWNSSPDRISASTSFWCCRRAINFYSSVFDREGYDNAGGNVDIFQNSGFINGDGTVSFSNASMSSTGGIMSIGNEGTPENTDDWNTLDIIGHEFTHAVTGATSKLVYQGESGALNESFSDIMGTYIEYWDGSSPFDWLQGEDRTNDIKHIRSLNDPKNFGLHFTDSECHQAKGQPNTYAGEFWSFFDCDWGGVHINSGVQNFWFYLLSQGGAGINDNGYSYTVNGQGIAVAGYIAYMTDAFYLTDNSQYIDAREQSIQAAEDAYGSCSAVALETAKAWYAVGVGGSQTSQENVCGEYTASLFSLRFAGIDQLNVSKSCTVTLNPANNSYNFSASNMVRIFPGFHAEEGSTVNLYIDPCSITNSLVANHQSTQRQTVQPIVPPVTKTPLDNKLIIYPNPAKSIITVEFSKDNNSSNATVQLFDMEGIKVKEVYLGYLPAGKQRIQLNLSTLSSGVYNLKVLLSKEQINTKVVLVR